MSELKQRFLLIFLAAWRRRWVIVVPILVLPFVALGVSKLAPLSYTAHTSMLIQETAKMNPFLQDIAVSAMLNERLNAVQTLLKSRHILQKVALEQGLINENTTEAEKERVIQNIAAHLRVNQMGKDLLKIQYTSSNPEGMKEMLESITTHFIEQLLAPERSSIRDSSQFLKKHIDQRFAQLQQSEQALADYTNQHSALTPELQSQTYSRIASLKQTLAEKEAELVGVSKSLGSLDQQLSKTNPVIGRIEERIIENRSELTLLRAKYTDNHSAVQAKQRELDRLEEERTLLLSSDTPTLNSDQLWDMASSQKLQISGSVQPLLMSQLQSLQEVRGRYESLKEETATLRTMIEKQEKVAEGFGDKVKQIHRLKRDVELKQQLYEELVQRYEMAQLTGSLGEFEESKRVKIIDRPYTPSRPSNLPSIIFVIAGVFAGIGLGIGLAILMELFDSTVRNPRDIKAPPKVLVLTQTY
ncbi:polysaccharide biosynthesis chain length regulator sypO [Vibrio ishigakensis]|uniref:Polysaccharide biosynthesis chain length regulator sypO n=1 Tax=Vibrio ishigakensis TaxID=1481914 RepID=A0A0B8P6B7_9VIBR|nr:GNVR domain-containing protein [Vibrio ishigakensis]GAM58464.1 polysaccharide biosynthesis chain length regulator sypO [Vibrio ishigakensis]